MSDKEIELETDAGFSRRVMIPSNMCIVQYFVLGYGVLHFYQSIRFTKDGVEIWTLKKPALH